MTFHLPTPDQIFGFIVLLVTVAIVVERAVEGLKNAPDSPLSNKNAGVINAVLSFIVAAAGFVLSYFGKADLFAGAQGAGAQAAAALVSWYTVAFLAFLLHKGIELRKGNPKD